jgi:hypothetical protein
LREFGPNSDAFGSFGNGGRIGPGKNADMHLLLDPSVRQQRYFSTRIKKAHREAAIRHKVEKIGLISPAGLRLRGCTVEKALQRHRPVQLIHRKEAYSRMGQADPLPFRR